MLNESQVQKQVDRNVSTWSEHHLISPLGIFFRSILLDPIQKDAENLSSIFFIFDLPNSLRKEKQEHLSFIQDQIIIRDWSQIIILKQIKIHQKTMRKQYNQQGLGDYSYQENIREFQDLVYQKQLEEALNFEFFHDEHFRISTSTINPKVQLNHYLFQDLPTLSTREKSQQMNHINEVGEDLHNMQVEEKSERPAIKQGKAQRRLKSEGKCERPSQKNQYDKNMIANISKALIKKMTSGDYDDELREYCRVLGVDFKAFFGIFVKIDREGNRMGSSQLNHFFYSEQYSQGIKKVFSYFFVRFLKEEYLAYVLNQGKMREKGKYLSCASKLMYIPKLTRREYQLIFRSSLSQLPQ